MLGSQLPRNSAPGRSLAAATTTSGASLIESFHNGGGQSVHPLGAEITLPVITNGTTNYNVPREDIEDDGSSLANTVATQSDQFVHNIGRIETPSMADDLRAIREYLTRLKEASDRMNDTL